MEKRKQERAHRFTLSSFLFTGAKRFHQSSIFNLQLKGRSDFHKSSIINNQFSIALVFDVGRSSFNRFVVEMKNIVSYE